MEILIVLLVIVAISGYICRNAGYSDWYEFPAVMTLIFSGVLLFGATISVPISRLETVDTMLRIEAIQQTAINGREIDALEGAAFRLAISEANQTIASLKYWNSTVFDIWYPDSVEKLEPIK